MCWVVLSGTFRRSHKRSTDSDDDEDTQDEGLNGYRKGGYHPGTHTCESAAISAASSHGSCAVNLGETYSSGRYRVVYKLGW